MIFALLHATLGCLLAALAVLALRRYSPDARCWAWRLGLLKGPLALALAIPIVVAGPLPTLLPRPPKPQTLVEVDQPAGDFLPSATQPVTSRSIPRPAVPIPVNPLPALYVSGLAVILACRFAATRRINPRMPRVQGVLRPKVVIPEDLDPTAAALALAHEQAHVRRRDPQWSFVADLVCLALWFAPPVWICARAMRAEAEAACDAEALRLTGAAKKTYANLLLSFTGPAPANALGGPARRLARRIAMLEKKNLQLPRLVTAPLLAAGLFALLPWSAKAQTPPAPTPAPQSQPKPAPKQIAKTKTAKPDSSQSLRLRKIAAERLAIKAEMQKLKAELRTLQAQRQSQQLSLRVLQIAKQQQLEATKVQQRQREKTIELLQSQQVKRDAERLSRAKKELERQMELQRAITKNSPTVSGKNFEQHGKHLTYSGDVVIDGERADSWPAPANPKDPVKVIEKNGTTWRIFRDPLTPTTYHMERLPEAPHTWTADALRTTYSIDIDKIDFQPDPNHSDWKVGTLRKDGSYTYKIYRLADGHSYTLGVSKKVKAKP